MICATVEIRDDGSVSEYLDWQDGDAPNSCAVCDARLERSLQDVIRTERLLQDDDVDWTEQQLHRMG